MAGLLLSIVLAQSAAPATTPSSAPPQPYPVIGHSRSKRYCELEIDRTNGAITVTLTDDKIISAAVGRLRAADLDRPELTVVEREKTMHDLRAIAAAIQNNLRAGAAQVADLRALAIKEPDASRSPELKAFADQIDLALVRQRTIGSDLAKMLTIVDGRYARAEGVHSASDVMPEQPADHARDGVGSIDERAARDPLDRLFADVADDFAQRTIAIGQAEDSAAVHAPKAVDGC